MRVILAILIGKMVGILSRLLGRGGGTSLPGLVAMRICHDIDARLASRLKLGCVIITGTNGKTTTAKMVAAILRHNGWRLVRNTSGANLRRGLVSTLIADATALGRPRGQFGLFEVDEATVPIVLGILKPRAVLAMNFFRDQLDRYGELDATARRMNAAFRSNLGPDATLVLNVDDPLVQALAEGCSAKVLPLGLEVEGHSNPEDHQAADTKSCPRCGADFHYSVRRFAHLGDYACTACDYRRETPTMRVTKVVSHGTDGLDLSLALPSGALDVSVGVPGLYNAYNVVGAAALCTALGLQPQEIAQGLTGFSAAFGRVERIAFPGNKTALLLLAKNPTGFNEVIRTVAEAGQSRHTMLALNDNTADGRDVSWIWDVDFERLLGVPTSLIASGIRAQDMALRLKYAGFDAGAVDTVPDTRQALQVALDRAAPYETVNVLLTYTALLDLRGQLEREGLAPHFWEE